MKQAYVIGHITVKNREKWRQYREQVPDTLRPWGAEVVLRGTCCSVLAGQHRHSDTVVIRFPDLNALNNWYSSAEYQLLLSLRGEAADMDLMSFEE